jgi:hypothetical protein
VTPWGGLALLLAGSAAVLALAVVVLRRAYREGDPGHVSDGWVRRQAADDQRR